MTDVFASLVNFALHLDTTGGTLYAADYPYFIEQNLREKFGKDFTLLFGTGTCGDINHFDVTTKDIRKPEIIGATLAGTVAAAQSKAIAQAEPGGQAGRGRSAHTEIHGGRDRAGEKGHGQDRHGRTCPSSIRSERTRSWTSRVAAARRYRLEVQVFRLSDEVAVVGLPGEVFVEHGLAIKKASPFPVTLVIELCQDDVAYVPTKKAFAEGSYETVNSRIAPGGGERMVEAAVRLLRELQPPPA